MSEPTRPTASRSLAFGNSVSRPVAVPPKAKAKAELSLKPPMARVSRNQTALGLVCTRSFPAVVGTADMMLKSSGVTLVGYEKTGDGYCTAVVRGNYADVKLAVQTGVDTAQKFEQYVSSMMLPRPLPNLDTVLPITEQFAEYVERAGDFEARGAIGLIETTGFPAMVGAADAAMKCANVELITYETTGAGLCTAVIQGPIADVTMAVEAGMQVAERIGDLHAIMVIPRPLDDLMKVMPKPKHLMEAPEEPQALELPEPETIRELEPLSLPELERVPVELPRMETLQQQEVEFYPPERNASPQQAAIEPKRLDSIPSDSMPPDVTPPDMMPSEVESSPTESSQPSLPRPRQQPLRLESAKVVNPPADDQTLDS